MPPDSPSRNCPYCAEPIAVAARKCKHCGEYLDGSLRASKTTKATHAAKRKTSPAAIGCLLILLFVGVAVMWSDSPPGQNRARNQAAFAADLSPEKQAERKRLIDQLVQEGVFSKVEKPATLPHVWITPAFRALDYDTKQQFISVVFLYYQPVDLVVLKDSLNGRRVGSYSPTVGLSLD